MTSQFRHKHPGDFLTFTTPLERRIPRPGPSRVTELERRVEALEAKCGSDESSALPDWPPPYFRRKP